MSVPSVVLNNGIKIPQLGFGVFQVDPDATKDAVLTALDVGYRHIDTAQLYGNERGVGDAVRESGVAREDVFVTSKLNNDVHAPADAIKAFDTSLEVLGFDYLDLFLIHWPMPKSAVDFVDTWRALEQIHASGRVRAIGVSNFHEHHLSRLLEFADIVPAVNQIEIHPYMSQDSLRAFGAARGIATQAWSPIAQGLVLDDPTITRIAKAIDKAPAQVVLRWHLQRGDIVFPKSVTRSRVEENAALFDFELSAEDMAAVSALNTDRRLGPDPEDLN
ncbi:aldo/keto reductase [Rhodococcus sp. 077-4]|uniref:aldo/keto reductase n=1 Tax=Rhodococcus sp. 077-4 TaxID=2789271 RepID=UPI0039F4BF33